MIDTTLASDNCSCFRKNLLDRIWKLVIAIDDKIRDEKLQYDINREAAKISALLSDKIEEILPSDQSRIIEQAKFTYSPLGKVFETQIKTIENQGIKQIETLKSFKSDENKQDIKSIDEVFPKEIRTNEIDEVNKMGRKIWKERFKIWNKKIDIWFSQI